MRHRIKLLFFQENKRSKEIRNNIILNVIFRGLGVTCGFLIVPITLTYIDRDEYGVWLTLTSITAWLSYMDVGIGNGLRNRVAEAIANDDKILAREYVSTAYGLFSLLVLSIIVVFSIVNIFLDWHTILKTKIDNSILILTAYVIVISFCIRLVLELFVTVLFAMQKSYIKSIVDFLISVLTLAIVYLLSRKSSASFFLFSSAVAVTPVLVLSILNYIFYARSEYAYLKPLIKLFNRQHIAKLLNIGLQFFFIQFVGIIIFSTDNILITKFLSPSEVTSFNIAYKYFSISTMLFSIIMLPYWSAFTNAYVKKDLDWIRGAFKRLLALWGIQLIGVVLLVFAAKTVYRLWVGKEIVIPFSLSITLGLYSVIFNWNNIFAYFLNGVGKIRLQLYNAIFVGIINIPLSYLLFKYFNLGVASVVVANSICLFTSSIWSPIQCYKIIKNRAFGIWNK